MTGEAWGKKTALVAEFGTNSIPRPGEDYLQPQPSEGKIKTGEAWRKNTAQQRQDKDREKSVFNHSPAEARPIPREARAKPQPSLNKTKTERSLYTTTAQHRQDQYQRKQMYNHM